MQCSRVSIADEHTQAHTSHPTLHFKEHGLIYGLWYGLMSLTKSPTFYCNESKLSHLHNRDYYLWYSQEMDVSFLFSLTFKLAIHSSTKVNTQPYTLTESCCIPTEQEFLELEQSSQPPPQCPGWQCPAGSLLHHTLFDRQTEETPGLISLKSFGCLSPSIIWGS